MSYSKKKVQIYNPKEWYNKAYKLYKEFHDKLNKWEKWIFKRFLPKSLVWLNILDLWWWDWRVLKLIEKKDYDKYIVFDISEKMLLNCKGKVDKIVWDLEEKLIFGDQEFDIVFAFFVVLHINNIQQLFEETYRVLKPWWKFIVFHHTERRPYEYNIYGDIFKIETYYHRYEDIEELARYCFFDVNIVDVIDEWEVVWKLYCFIKN